MHRGLHGVGGPHQTGKETQIEHSRPGVIANENVYVCHVCESNTAVYEVSGLPDRWVAEMIEAFSSCNAAGEDLIVSSPGT